MSITAWRAGSGKTGFGVSNELFFLHDERRRLFEARAPRPTLPFPLPELQAEGNERSQRKTAGLEREHVDESGTPSNVFFSSYFRQLD
jgi:hypothetical protein